MSDKITTKRGIYLYINGKQINNDIRSVAGEMKRLQAEQAGMTIGSDKYIQAGKRIRVLDQIMRDHRRQWRETNTEIGKTKDNLLSFGKVTNAFNKYFAIITAAVASLTGLSFAARKCVDDFAALEESEANVRKYTGMTKDEIKDLNESFKKMDTRAARTTLNQLAADAGKLGIQGKKDLLEFVEGANIINVALGADLGDDAVKNIGKLTQMFNLDQVKGLKDGMLSVASAVNEVAQNSSAAEKYLVAFTARVAGTGKQAGIALPNIMGYASVLDQSMLRSEMAATALQKVWLKMYQEPQKFAELAGKSVQDFTDLVLTDANEAFLQLMESLSKKGGLMQLAPIFEEMKLDGTESIGVLNTLVASVEKIRREQKVANEAFIEGTSVVDEFNVQNNTLQATIEKAKKKFQEYAYAIGQELAPHMGMAFSKTGSLLKVLGYSIKLLIQYGPILLKATIVLISYTAAVKTHTLWSQRKNAVTAVSIALTNTYKAALAFLALTYNTLTKNVFAARRALVAFNAATKANPVGIFVAIITSAVLALTNYISKVREATKYTRQMRGEIIQEEQAANQLFSTLIKAGEGTEQRSRLVKEINEIYGDYLPNLLTEESTLRQILEAQDSVNRAIRTNIALKTQKEAIDSIEKNALEKKAKQIEDIRQKLLKKLPDSEVEVALSQIIRQTDKAIQKGFTAQEALFGVYKNLKDGFFGGNSDNMDSKTAKELEDYIDVVYATAAKIVKEKQKYNPFISDLPHKNELPEVVITAGNKIVENINTEAIDDFQNKIDALEIAYQEKLLQLKRALKNQEITEEEMQLSLFHLETEYIADKINLYEQYSKSAIDLEIQMTDKIIAEAERRKKLIQKVNPEEEKSEENSYFNELAKGLDIQYAMNEALYNANLISHGEYIFRKSEMDEQYRREKEQRDRAAAEKEKAIRESVLGTISGFANSAANIMQAAQSREEAAIEKKYKYKLILAEGDNEATAALEEQKEAELLEIKKRYADKTFAMNVLSVTADTAVAAMRAYSAMAGIPVVGPALGAAAAAAAVAAGAAQIAIASQQRDQVQNMWDGGFTGEGGKYEKKKLIQTHGGEFVANKQTVQLLRPVFDIMDYAQRTGNVAMLTGSEMSRALGSTYTASQTAAPQSKVAGQTASTNPDILRALESNTRMMNLLRAKLNEPFVGEVYVDGPRGIKKNLSDYDQLIKNATR